MPMHYASVRLDVTREQFSSYIPIFNAISGVWYAVCESSQLGANPHVHTFQEFEHASTSWTSARRLLQNRLQSRLATDGLVGNAGYAITKVTDIDGWKRYLAKGTGKGHPPEEHIIGSQYPFSDEDVTELHDRYWQINDDIRATTKKKRTNEDLIKEVIQDCNDASLTGDNRRAIADIVISRHCKILKPIAVPYVKSVVNLVSCTLDNVHARSELINRIINDF